MSQYFPKPYDCSGENVKFKLDLSHHANNLASKLNLSKSKAEVDKKDVGKLKSVLVDLSKLSNVVDNEVVKKAVYDKLVAKADAIDNNGFVLESKYDTDKSDLEKENQWRW